MTRSPLPENWQELLAGYALGNLDSEEAQVIERLLERHPELKAELNRFQSTLTLMPYALPEKEPSPRLRSTILEAAQAGKRPAALQTNSRSSRFNLGRWRWQVGGAIAALLAIALGVNNYQLRRELQAMKADRQTRQSSTPLLYVLEGTEAATNASGRLIVNPNQQAVVLVQNLPELPSGQAYRLWAIADDDAQPIYCGQFNSDAIGTASTQWALPEATCATAVSQMLITVESSTAPPVPQGELVMQGTQANLNGAASRPSFETQL